MLLDAIDTWEETVLSARDRAREGKSANTLWCVEAGVLGFRIGILAFSQNLAISIIVALDQWFSTFFVLGPPWLP